MTFKRLVLVDTFELNEEARQRLQNSSEATVNFFDHDPADETELAERVGDADAIIVSWRTKIDAEFLRSHPNIRYIGQGASPFLDPSQCNIDLDAAHDLDIVVSALGQYGDEATAEWVIASMLNAAHHIGPLAWRKERTELFDKNLAVIGIGAVGFEVAVRARALGMHVAYTSRQDRPEADALGFRHLSITDALAAADVITVHIAKGVQIMSAREFAVIEAGTMLINTSIGAILEPSAFADWLANGEGVVIGDSSMDPRLTEPMKGADNAFLSTQLAADTVEMSIRRGAQLAENAEAFLAGAPIRTV